MLLSILLGRATRVHRAAQLTLVVLRRTVLPAQGLRALPWPKALVKEDGAAIAALTAAAHRLIHFLKLLEEIVLETVVVHIISLLEHHFLLIVFTATEVRVQRQLLSSLVCKEYCILSLVCQVYRRNFLFRNVLVNRLAAQFGSQDFGRLKFFVANESASAGQQILRVVLPARRKTEKGLGRQQLR